MTGSIEESYMNEILEGFQYLQAEISQFKTKLANKHQRQIKRIEQLQKEDLDELEEIYMEDDKIYESIISQKRKEIKDLEHNINEKNNENVKLQSVLDEKGLEIQSLQHRIDEINSEKEKIQADIEQKIKESANLRQKIAEKDIEIEKLKSIIEGKQQEINNIQTLICQKEKEKDSLNHSISEKERDNSEWRRIRDEKNREVSRLEGRLNDKVREINNLNNDLRTKNREITNLRSRYDDKCQENRELQRKINKYEHKFDSSRRDVKIIKSEMNSTKEREAIETAKKSFDHFSNFGSRAEYIRDHFDEKYGRSWHCIFGEGNWSAYFHNENNEMIHFKIGIHGITLYKCGD